MLLFPNSDLRLPVALRQRRVHRSRPAVANRGTVRLWIGLKLIAIGTGLAGPEQAPRRSARRGKALHQHA